MEMIDSGILERKYEGIDNIFEKEKFEKNKIEFIGTTLAGLIIQVYKKLVGVTK